MHVRSCYNNSTYTPPLDSASIPRAVYVGSQVLSIMVSYATKSQYDFVEKASQGYFCPVTFELLKDPRQTNGCRGKNLSRAAAKHLEAQGKACPLCKKALLMNM